MKYKNIILVTGGAGNIGSSLVKELLKKKDNFVIVIDNLITGSKKKLPSKNIINWEFLKVNINKFNDLKLNKKIKRIDYIFHFAALVGVTRTQDKPLEVLSDIEGFKNILSISLKYKVKRIFFSSSSEVYGESIQFPQKENKTPLNSRLPYSVVKNLGEIFFITYKKKYNLDYTIFRFFNTYGPNQSDDFVVSRFIKNAIAGRNLILHGDGKQSRTFCYIDDNIKACLKCLYKNKFINSTLNIGSENEITMLKLAKLVIKITNSSSKITHTEPRGEGDMKRRLPDITKMKKLIGNKMTTIDEGIYKTYLHFKNDK